MIDTTVPVSSPLPLPQIARYLAATALLTWLADLLFWRASVGINLGIFASTAAALLLLVERPKRWNRKTCAAVVLLLATAAQSAIEISLSNVVVLITLLVWFLGESHFPHLSSEWGRWVEAQFALVRAPERWAWMWRSFERSSTLEAAGRYVEPARIVRVLQILAPAVVLGFIFVLVLSSGNAVLRDVLATMSERVAGWIGSFDFSLGRLLFWCVAGSLALAWFTPARDSIAGWAWAKHWPVWKRSDESVAIWQSLSVLLVLNGLFFAANTLDVIYLWLHARLPEGVTPSQYVHSGVASLILAVLLSAAVLAGIFQQESQITKARGVRELAYGWIVQNFLLIAGVFMRLKLYVDAYHWSELRVYVGCFLLLVTAGFGTLVWKIRNERTMGWLVLANIRLTLALFFALQFVDVAGQVAHANVSQWVNNRDRGLDINYLSSLGPSAWTALDRVAGEVHSPIVSYEARERLESFAEEQQARLAQADWRSWQVRRDRLARWLIAKYAPPVR